MPHFIDPATLGLQAFSISDDYEARVLCPFHADHNPSAVFNLQSGLFYCFTCQETASAEQLAGYLGGEVVKRRSSVIIRSLGLPQRESEFEWRSLLKSPLAYDNPYLLSRGVTNRQVEEHSILDTGKGVLVPIYNTSSSIVGAIQRKYEGRPKYLYYGVHKFLWPIKFLQENKFIYVVEGIFGVLRAEKYGYPAVATMGAAPTHTMLKQLNGHLVRVVYDDDYAGALGSAKMVAVGHRALCPGVEADELTEAEWGAVDRAHLNAGVNDFYETIHPNAQRRFKKLVYKFKNSWYNNHD